jgi:nucleotide-binding universal stress UspA family protein
MGTPSTILVATDFSETARRAFDAALALAEREGASLHLIHALEVPLPIFEPYAVAVPAEFIGEARKAAQERLDALLEEVKAKGLQGSAHLGEVPAGPAVAERAQAVGADLVVVGTRGHTGLRHALLGSVAERTVKDAPCSVLTVKEGGNPVAPRVIVVGIDFSDGSGEALEQAAALAARTRAKLHLVHALDLRIPLVTPYEVTVPDAWFDSALEGARRRLEKLALELPQGVEATHEVRSEPPHEAVCGAAEAHSADLIVTGSRGLTGLKHVVLGSVAERTLRHAPCSVLTVRERER